MLGPFLDMAGAGTATPGFGRQEAAPVQWYLQDLPSDGASSSSSRPSASYRVRHEKAAIPWLWGRFARALEKQAHLSEHKGLHFKNIRTVQVEMKTIRQWTRFVVALVFGRECRAVRAEGNWARLVTLLDLAEAHSKVAISEIEALILQRWASVVCALLRAADAAFHRRNLAEVVAGRELQRGRSTWGLQDGGPPGKPRAARAWKRLILRLLHFMKEDEDTVASQWRSRWERLALLAMQSADALAHRCALAEVVSNQLGAKQRWRQEVAAGTRATLTAAAAAGILGRWATLVHRILERTRSGAAVKDVADAVTTLKRERALAQKLVADQRVSLILDRWLRLVLRVEVLEGGLGALACCRDAAELAAQSREAREAAECLAAEKEHKEASAKALQGWLRMVLMVNLHNEAEFNHKGFLATAASTRLRLRRRFESQQAAEAAERAENQWPRMVKNLLVLTSAKTSAQMGRLAAALRRTRQRWAKLAASLMIKKGQGGLHEAAMLVSIRRKEQEGTVHSRRAVVSDQLALSLPQDHYAALEAAERRAQLHAAHALAAHELLHEEQARRLARCARVGNRSAMQANLDAKSQAQLDRMRRVLLTGPLCLSDSPGALPPK